MAGENEVPVKITSDTRDGEAGIDRVGNKLKELDGPVREVLEGFGQLRKTFIEAFAVTEISELIEHVAELGEQAVRSSQMLGISVEKVQELGFAAKMVGGNSEGMTVALERLEKNMADISNPTSMAAKAFTALGISEQDVKDKSPDQVLGLIADKFANAQDGAGKTAIAMDLMGRSGAQMIPLLNEGSAGLEKMGVIAKDTGTVLTTMQAEGLEQTSQGLTTLKTSAEGTGIAFVELLKPAIDAIISGLTTLTQYLTDIFASMRELSLLIDSVLLLSLAKLIEIFQEFGAKAQKIIEDIKISFTVLGQVIEDVTHGQFRKAVDDWKNGLEQMNQANIKAGDELLNIQHNYDELSKSIQKATDQVIHFSGAESESGKKSLHAPSTGTEDNSEEKNQIAIEKSNLATQLELDKISIQSRKEADAEKVASGQMTKAQELADLREFAGQEWQLNMQALDREAALYDEDSAEYNALINKKKVMTAQYNAEISKLNAQSAEQQRHQWDTLFNGIDQSFKTMINGILQGTQTWHQAMGRLFENLAIKFIDDLVITPAIKWLESQAQKLIATETTNAAIVASDTATAGASHAAMVAKNVATVTADAAVTFAGVFANQAPFLGPAAAAPAAAAEALVMAQIPQASLDVGAWNLDSNIVAQLHQGEMVIPATFAQGIRDGGSIGGGNNTINFNVSAMDGQSVSQFFKSNGAALASAINAQLRNGNSQLLSTQR